MKNVVYILNKIFPIILVGFLCGGTLFATSNHYVDAYLMPKWIIALGGFCVLVLYWVVNSLFIKGESQDELFIRAVPYIVVLFTSFQALYGILQYFHVLPSLTGFRVTGSFDNPAGFAACLSCTFPFYLFLASKKGDKFRPVYTCLMILLVMAIIASGSRSGILSFVIVLLIWLGLRLKSSLLVKMLLIVSVVMGLTYALYQLNRDSANGRVLIWKCSMEMLKDQWLVGYGTGGFEKRYMDYQADYFRQTPNSPYTKLADDVQYPFNEFLYIGINYGCIGLLLVLLLFYGLYKSYKKNPSLDKRVALLCWIAVAVFSSFSYPLMYPFVWLVLAYSAFVLTKDLFCRIVSKLHPVCIRCFFYLMIPLMGCVMFKVYSKMNLELKWGGAVRLASLGKMKEAIPIYKSLYADMQSNRYFLYNYAARLYYAKRYEESLRVALQCKEYWSSYDLEILIGQLHEQLGALNKAKEHYVEAGFMCPVRLLPSYYLALLFYKEGNLLEAKKMAKCVVDKPLKVESSHALQIKNEMEDLYLGIK